MLVFHHPQKESEGTASGPAHRVCVWLRGEAYIISHGQMFKSYKENRNEGNEVKRKILKKKKTLIIAYVYADNTDQQRLVT